MVKANHYLIALPLALGMLASTQVHAENDRAFDNFSYYGEARYGTARVSALGFTENVNAYSIAGGVQVNHIASFRGEYMSTLDDTDRGFGWSVLTLGMQLERDAYRNGFGFYSSVDLNSVSTDSAFGGNTGSFFGFSLGARYQFPGGHRVFVDGKLHSGDFGFLSAGLRYQF